MSSKKLKKVFVMVFLLMVAGGDSYCFALRNLSNYDVKADYRYDFSGEVNSVRNVIVKVFKDYFELPKGNSDWDKGTTLQNDGRLYLYSNHYFLGKSYQFGEQRSVSSVPPHFSDIKFRSLYSHAVPQQTQVEKLFALDSMHDLRPMPYRVNISTFGFLNNTAHALVDYLRNGSEFDLSYYRRAIKANELFFVYSFDDATEILSGYKTNQQKKLSINRFSE